MVHQCNGAQFPLVAHLVQPGWRWEMSIRPKGLCPQNTLRPRANSLTGRSGKPVHTFLDLEEMAIHCITAPARTCGVWSFLIRRMSVCLSSLLLRVFQVTFTGKDFQYLSTCQNSFFSKDSFCRQRDPMYAFLVALLLGFCCCHFLYFSINWSNFTSTDGWVPAKDDPQLFINV